MIERTTVRLPHDLLNRARRQAVAEGRTLTALIEEGLRLVVADRRKKPKAREVSLPLSTATGGLMPGIDLRDSAALQEIDDLEIAERMKPHR